MKRLIPSNVGDKGFRAAATGDFDNDGNEDIIFQHEDGTLKIWFMRGTLQTSEPFLAPSNPGDKNWRAMTAGDIDRDGKADLILQHTDGKLAVWYMDGFKLKSSELMNPSSADLGWAVASADFNADGAPDLVFQLPDGNMTVWLLDRNRRIGTILLNPVNSGVGWRLAGTGRFSRRLTVALTGDAGRPD